MPSFQGGSTSSTDQAPGGGNTDAVAQPSPHGEDPSDEPLNLADLEFLPPPGTDLKQVARSIAHLTTHRPKNPHCPVCARAKMTKSHAKKSNIPPEDRPTEFGDHVTGDHLFEKKKHAWDGGNTALNMLDVGTRFRAIYPLL